VKLSDLSDQEWFSRLESRRIAQSAKNQRWWAYYDGEQPLYYIAKILEEQENRFPPLTINWALKLIDWIDARCSVEGFRIASSDSSDDALWEIWQRNHMDRDQSENNVGTLVTSLGYVMVTPDSTGRASISVMDPSSIAVELDPRTREPIAALVRWSSDPDVPLPDMGELWLPGRKVEFVEGKPEGSSPVRYVASDPVAQKSQAIPVVPFHNRRRGLSSRSELAPIKPLIDAANQVATNMLAAIEQVAVPRKWALNVDPGQFVDKDGNPVPAWKAAMGAVWALPFDEENSDAPEPQVGQFTAAEMRNFHDTISLLARVAAGLMDLAPSELGVGVADNPPGADGVRAAKESGVRRVERFQVGQGDGYEDVMRLAWAIEENDPKKLVRLETIWRDPSTPTRESMTAAAVASLGSGLADLRQAREDAGYTDTQIKLMEARESEARVDPVSAALIAELERADPAGGA